MNLARIVKLEILYILGAYKPKASANGICSEKIINQLIQEGHRVTVISNQYLCNSKCNENKSEINHYVKQRVYLRLMDYGDALPVGAKKTLVYKLAFLLNKFQLFFSWKSWPIVSKKTVRRFTKTALNLCEKNKYDAVIAVYTPIEALLAGKAVKEKYPQIKFYPYFLDSLSGGYGPKFFKKESIIRIGLKYEKNIFSIADRVIIMKSSYNHHLKYNSEYKDKLCVLDIPMLSQCSRITAGQIRTTRRIKLLFVGSIAKKIRNPDSLISALLQVNNLEIECEFIGNIDCVEKFDELKNKYKDRLKITSYIQHDALQQIMLQADAFINIGNSFPNMVPSKIFEYMSYGKPIISTYSIDNEPSIEYLEKYPLSLLLNDKESSENNARLIEKFLSTVPGQKISFAELNEIFYLNTPAAFTKEVFKEDK